jgi:hypothetical protein
MAIADLAISWNSALHDLDDHYSEVSNLLMWDGMLHGNARVNVFLFPTLVECNHMANRPSLPR